MTWRRIVFSLQNKLLLAGLASKPNMALPPLLTPILFMDFSNIGNYICYFKMFFPIYKMKDRYKTNNFERLKLFTWNTSVKYGKSIRYRTWHNCLIYVKPSLFLKETNKTRMIIYLLRLVFVWKEKKKKTLCIFQYLVRESGLTCSFWDSSINWVVIQRALPAQKSQEFFLAEKLTQKFITVFILSPRFFSLSLLSSAVKAFPF